MTFDDANVHELLQSSAVFNFATRSMLRVRHAVDGSAARAVSSALVARWQARPLTARRFDLGVTLLVAVAVHLALQMWQGPDPGWLWLIVPTTAAVIGALFIAASRAPESP
jgi:hypothetical protein